MFKGNCGAEHAELLHGLTCCNLISREACLTWSSHAVINYADFADGCKFRQRGYIRPQVRQIDGPSGWLWIALFPLDIGQEPIPSELQFSRDLQHEHPEAHMTAFIVTSDKVDSKLTTLNLGKVQFYQLFFFNLLGIEPNPFNEESWREKQMSIDKICYQ